MLYSDYQVHVMGHVPYVGFATYHRATVRIRFTFYNQKKKKKRVVTASIPFGTTLFCIGLGW
jgi:hypothetical protein